MEEEDEENLPPLSESFNLQTVKNSDLKVTHRCTLGSMYLDEEQTRACQTMCVRFDPHDKYLAQGRSDGAVVIWNVHSNKEAFVLNPNMEEPMPMMMVRWRPAKSQAITKNVVLTVNANGSLQHWHTTSGKLLHTIFDELNQLLCCDYNHDGTQFCSGGSDTIVRVYDE